MSEASLALIQDILNLDVPSTLRLSPDGKSVVYTTTTKWHHKKGKEIERSIWMADFGIEHSARTLTDGTFNDRIAEWAPHGNEVAFLSDRGGKGKACAIYIVNKHGEEMRPLTPAENERSISKFAFSPDGKSIAYIAVPEKSAEKKAKEENKDDAIVWGQDWEFAHLWLLDVESKEVKVLYGEDRHVSDFAWSDEGDGIAIVTNRTPHIESEFLHGVTISTIQLPTGEVKKVCDVARNVSSLVWSGSGLYFIANNVPEKDTSGFAVYSAGLGQDAVKAKKIAHGESNCASKLLKARSKVIVHVEDGMDDLLCILNGTTLMKQSKRIVDFNAILHEDINDSMLVVALGDVNKPTEVFAVKGTDTIQLSNHGSGIAGKHFGDCIFIECPTFDGKEKLEGTYLVPAQHMKSDETSGPSQPLPTVVLMHGGPYARRTNCFDVWDAFYLLVQAFLSEGIGIMVPNYRGSSGRGERFADYAAGGMGVEDEPDIVAMTQHIIDLGYADKNRLVAGGWSQGGHLAYLLAVRNGTHGRGWRFNGLIAGAGVTDWDGMSLAADIGSMEAQYAGGVPWDMDKIDVKSRTGSAIWEFRDAARDGRIPPMLMLHGERDARVPVSQADAFRRALEAAGLPFEFVTYPRETHNISERKHLEDLLERTFHFVKTHLV